MCVWGGTQSVGAGSVPVQPGSHQQPPGGRRGGADRRGSSQPGAQWGSGTQWASSQPGTQWGSGCLKTAHLAVALPRVLGQLPAPQEPHAARVMRKQWQQQLGLLQLCPMEMHAAPVTRQRWQQQPGRRQLAATDEAIPCSRPQLRLGASGLTAPAEGAAPTRCRAGGSTHPVHTGRGRALGGAPDPEGTDPTPQGTPPLHPPRDALDVLAPPQLLRGGVPLQVPIIAENLQQAG